jgi:hypothetical protein
LKVVSIPGKGWGVIATQHITIGTRIWSEWPLFYASSYTGIRACFNQFGKSLEPYYGDLHHFASDHLISEVEHWFASKWDSMPPDFKEFLQVFWPNHVHGHMILKASRMNHSCVPNVYFSFNSNSGKASFYAIRDVQPGDELTRSYLPDYCFDLTLRQSYLVGAYGFTCTCEACIDRSDRRRFGAERGRIFSTGPDFLYKQDRERPLALGDWTKCKKTAVGMANALGHVPSRRCMDV